MSEAQADRLARLGGLYAIVGDLDPVGRAEAVVAGGARVVQVRMKRSGAGAILEAARRIAALARGRALVLVNDRPDLALLAGADGVHLGEEDLPVAEARSLVGPALLVGRTARTLGEARAALAAGDRRLGAGYRIEVADDGVEPPQPREPAGPVPAGILAHGGSVTRA